jgi:uncharacterized lipoprotein YajG
MCLAVPAVATLYEGHLRTFLYIPGCQSPSKILEENKETAEKISSNYSQQINVVVTSKDIRRIWE